MESILCISKYQSSEAFAIQQFQDTKHLATA